MNITPPLPDLIDPVRREIVDAVIMEAKRRARRRRGLYAVTAVVALFAASLMVFFGRLGPPSLGAGNEPPGLSRAAPEGRDQAARVVAEYGKIHAGWILVYEDGRVLGFWDSGQVLERRLTAEGLDLVRSGAVQPSALHDSSASLPEDVWADAEFTPYVPARWATCLFGGIDAPRPVAASEAVGRLPTAVQALLHGKERTYRINSDHQPDKRMNPYSGLKVRYDCSSVSAQSVPVLLQTLKDIGFTFDWGHPFGNGAGGCGWFARPAQAGMCFHAVLPHGTWVSWGG